MFNFRYNQKYKTGYFLLFWLLVSVPYVQAQEGVKVVKGIEIKGNYKTKTWVILEEIPFKTGDTLRQSRIAQHMQKVRNNLINTYLFSQVSVDTTIEEDDIYFQITVRELWYLYPGFIFELADRNFNTWWSEQKRSLKRVNIGGQLKYDNATGRNDYLLLIMHTGYTNKIQLTYEMPRFYNNKKWGWGIHLFQRTQKEIGFLTIDNKTVFYKSDDILLKRQRIETYSTYRPAPNRIFRLTTGFQNNQIHPIIIKDFNNNFFNPNQTRQRFYTLEAFGKMQHLEREVYPIEGMGIEAFVRKEGLGIYRDIDVLYWNILWRIYARLPLKNWSYGGVSRLQRQRNPRGVLPFYNRSFIGYSDDQLRGYELYVVDGPEYFYTKQHIKYKLFDRSVQLHKRQESFLRAFKVIPMEVYLIFQLDVARVEGYTEHQNNLNDRWLFGGGPGLHLVTFNRYVYRLEYSFNQLGESGIFIHVNKKY